MVIDGASPPDTKRTRSAGGGHDRLQHPAGVFSSSFLHEDKADIQRQILFAIRFIPEPFVKADIVHALVAGKELNRSASENAFSRLFISVVPIPVPW
jgi:hypothetical protein